MFAILKKLMEMLPEKQHRTVYLYSVMSVISPLVDLAGISLILPIMNQMMTYGATRELMLETAILGFVMLLKGCFDLYRTTISNRMTFQSAKELSSKMFELMLHEDLVDHSKKTIMQGLAGVRSDTTTSIGLIAVIIGICINAVMYLLYCTAMVINIGTLGAAVSVLMVLLVVGNYFAHRHSVKTLGVKRRKMDIQLNALVTTSFGAFKEMKIDDRSDLMQKRYDNLSQEFVGVQSSYRIRAEIISVIMQNSVQACLYFVLAIFMFLNIDITSALARVIVFATILIKLIPVGNSIVSGLMSVQYGKHSFEIVSDAYDRWRLMKDKEREAVALPKTELTLKKGISVRGLSFAYTEGRDIFTDADIDIPAGKSIAVIGQSGAGKTTFLDLILGLLHPRSGAVYYDDYDIVSGTKNGVLMSADLGDIVSYIPQIVYLNGETVKNNVAFMMAEKDVNEERIIECLKTAQIWEDVQQMPDGMDTLIGENGTAISGGQRQRIALARALYKEFELLIMDEATAALDMETEKAVLDSIRQVKGQKTLLMVTHHMSLANECDIVYKIEDRKIVKVRG